MNDAKTIANLILPDINTTTEHFEKKYPERNLPTNAMVTRFAPSPTGFLHLGSLFASLISERLAHQTEGVFYLRVEDTDKKREVEGATEELVRALKLYNIYLDEGPIAGLAEEGIYGPYKQSNREIIYKTYIKGLIEKNLAYPCFCSHEELASLRKNQEEQKENTGYYGAWSKCRNLTLSDIKDNLLAGKSFVIRLKSPGSSKNKIEFMDMIKGKIEMPENDQDIVIMKSDGLPTYHFAHAIDDHLMKTTHVIRGEEWLSSVPVHMQLFEVLNFSKLNYAHISNIMKMDGSSKRKLSKRKDPELSVSFYDKEGYPYTSVIEYLLNLINSNFEEWRYTNTKNSYTDFIIDMSKMGAAGPLFDINKLNDMSKNVIAAMTAKYISNQYLTWAKKYDNSMFMIVSKDLDKLVNIFNIDREISKPRKDIAKWSEVSNYIGYFYDEVFHNIDIKNVTYPQNINNSVLCEILTDYTKTYHPLDDKDTWFGKIKELSIAHGFSGDTKAYKKNPQLFKGSIGDVAMILRLSLTAKSNTPDLYDIMKILGKERIVERLNNTISWISQSL